jgi:hypothetical protein
MHSDTTHSYGLETPDAKIEQNLAFEYAWIWSLVSQSVSHRDNGKLIHLR